MLRELLSIFRASDPLAEVGDNFARMLKLTHDMNLAAGQIFFEKDDRKTERDLIYERDGEVNELERTIRRQVVTHLAVPGSDADLPYSLLLISLVKDVERLGDYAKNLAELADIRPELLPEGSALSELISIRRRVEFAFQACADVFVGSRKDKAAELIRQGRETARRCDLLISEIGQSDYRRRDDHCVHPWHPLLQADRRACPQRTVERRHASGQGRLLRRRRAPQERFQVAGCDHTNHEAAPLVRRTAHVVVIGAGVIGCAVAYEIAPAGRACSRGRPA